MATMYYPPRAKKLNRATGKYEWFQPEPYYLIPPRNAGVGSGGNNSGMRNILIEKNHR
jgi:hypothetical protein